MGDLSAMGVDGSDLESRELCSFPTARVKASVFQQVHSLWHGSAFDSLAGLTSEALPSSVSDDAESSLDGGTGGGETFAAFGTCFFSAVTSGSVFVPSLRISRYK